MDSRHESRGGAEARRSLAWGGAAVFALLALGLQLPIYDRSIVPMDEGHLAAVSMWIQNGKYLYKDLHSGIFPGIYHFTSVLFWIFGNDLVVARWAEVATNLSITLCLWASGLRVMRPGFAAVAPLLYLALIPVGFPVLTMFNYSSLSLGLSMLSLFFLLRIFDTGARGDAIGLGVALALAVIAKQNFGALAFIACLAALLAWRRGSALEGRGLVAVLMPIAISGIVVTLGVLSYFLVTGTLMDLLESTVIQLGGDQLQSFNNPIPPIFGRHPATDPRFVFLYTPPGFFNTMLHGETILGQNVTREVHSLAIRLSYGIPLVTLVAGALLALATWREDDPSEARRIRVPVLFALLFFLGIFPSAIWSHLAFILPPILLLIGLLMDRADLRWSRRGSGAAIGWRAVCAAIVLFASGAGVSISADIARWHPTPLELPRASLYVSPGQAQLYRAAVRFIDDCAPPGEPIFVAPYMPVVYFLSGRANATRYDLTIPGNVEGDLIIVGLDQNRARCIVYEPVMYPEFPPFRELFPKVNRYLRRNYEERQTIEGGGSHWQGLVRRTAFSQPRSGARAGKDAGGRNDAGSVETPRNAEAPEGELPPAPGTTVRAHMEEEPRRDP